MQRPSLLSLILFCSLTLHAQQLDWQWGNFQRSKGRLISIMAGQNSAFSTIHSVNSLSASNNALTLYEDLQAVASQRIKPVSPEGFGYFEQAIRLGKQHLVFISDRNGKEMKLFAKILDAELNTLDEREIIHYTDTRPNTTPHFGIIQAPNQAYFAVYYQIPGKRNGADIYGFSVYDQSLKVISKGEYGLPFDANLSSIEDFFLSNDGEFFIGVIELEEVENQGIRVRKTFKNLHVYQFNNTGLQDYTFDLQGKRISNFVMNGQDAQSLTLFGIYSNSDWDGMQDGFFNVQLNLQADTAMAMGFLPFSQEIMLSEHKSADQIRIQKKLDRRNEDPQLSRYQVRDIFTLKDGSYVGSLEKYYVYTSTNINNQTGQRMTTNYYYYNDIIAFCIDSMGKLRWEQRIPKTQVSINDFGPYSSYASFVDGQNLHFLFNDAASNYDQTGQFKLGLEEVNPFSLSKNRNVGAWVQINLEDGSMHRQVSHQRSEKNILLVPKAFEIDRLHNGLITYGVLGPQEIFGYIQLQFAP